MSTDILVVQHIDTVPAGLLGRYLELQGAWLHTWNAAQRSHPPQGEYHGLLVLGGPMQAWDDEHFPHLQRTMTLIRQFHRQHKPVLGICLGAQLIARSFGAAVYANTTPELGFTPLFPVATAAPEPWLQNFPDGMPMLEWHFDTFDLPAGADWLMTSDRCKHQAFRLGSHTYGLQFHPEATPDIFRGWWAFLSNTVKTQSPHLLEEVQQQFDQHWAKADQFTETLAQCWYAQVQAAAQDTPPCSLPILC
ncbi:GMP synthase [Leptolyngbya sp. BL0902]|uniref:type 1 glutamine amidotransferase n=1 Tax=Leptolyngbya sp. BL0902 TaxID=1115757 RepID=UPI0018E865BB|nr:gamma-glutamyl-gamma-aminobutyrate hydrolase family protein [Leptolyngbya sp. BL0902]QQE64991.1 GMP synthase [Leptolyngbya sp. BL0902]